MPSAPAVSPHVPVSRSRTLLGGVLAALILPATIAATWVAQAQPPPSHNSKPFLTAVGDKGMTLNMSALRYPVSLVDVCLLIPAGGGR